MERKIYDENDEGGIADLNTQTRAEILKVILRFLIGDSEQAVATLPEVNFPLLDPRVRAALGAIQAADGGVFIPPSPQPKALPLDQTGKGGAVGRFRKDTRHDRERE